MTPHAGEKTFHKDFCVFSGVWLFFLNMRHFGMEYRDSFARIISKLNFNSASSLAALHVLGTVKSLWSVFILFILFFFFLVQT